MNDVQGLVDALALKLERPIGVDDNHFRLVAHSAHGQMEDVDSVRLAKLLQREANAEVSEWLERHGVRGNEPFARVPRCDRLEMAARIIVPLRFDRELMGFLALMDEPDPYSEEELDEALRCSSDLAAALYRQRRLHLDDRDPDAETARAILGLPNDAEGLESPPDPYSLLDPRPAYGCLVVRAVALNPEGSVPTRVGVRLAASAARLRQVEGMRQVVALSESNYSVAIVGANSAGDLRGVAGGLFEDLENRFVDHDGCRPVVGIGGAVEGVDGLRESFDQARAAAFLAGIDDRCGPIAEWGRLGADGTIAQLLDETDPESAIPDSIRRLVERPDGESLVSTAETYLDNAADTAATAAALYVHRTSLYHRLRRIEEIAEVDLSTGDGRLELHLGLRLLRLAGGSADGSKLAASLPPTS